MIEKIKGLIESNPLGFSIIIQHNAEMLKFINDEFSEILENTKRENGVSDIDVNGLKFITKIYLVVNGLKSLPKCPVCNRIMNDKNVQSMKKGYPRTCSNKCQGKDSKVREKYIRTCLEKYGSVNYLSSKTGKKKRDGWCKSRGVSNPFQLDWVNEKSRETRKRLYGVEYTMQSEEKRRLASDNYMRKHGYDSQFHDPSVIEKIRTTRIRHIENGFDEKELYRKNARKRRYNEMMGNPHVVPNFTLEDFTKLDVHSQYTTLLNWHCKDCGTDFDAFIDANWSSRRHIPSRCVKCNPYLLNGASREENAIGDFLSKECGVATDRNVKTIIPPMELDVVVKSRKIAIEYDGLFWHSEQNGGKTTYYHLSKTEMCKKVGYRLIHVFEDEWLEKGDIVRSRLKNMLGLYDRTVYARKCEVRKIARNESMEFQRVNHLQGAVGSIVSLGLYENGGLVSLMTFGKPRYNRKYEWELLRFCNKLGYHVVGGAGKLLKHFEREYSPKSLISYADRRWSEGNLYEKLGFSFVSMSDPAYWYTKRQKRYSRIMFQKHKLKDRLPVFYENKTERENMELNGYSTIWDCGNLVYEKKYAENKQTSAKPGDCVK